MTITRAQFGHAEGGTPVYLYTLTNGNGLQARITNFGCRVVSLFAPDRYGQPADVVLGFDDLDSYTQKHQYFGALVGRVANRIAGARVTINGVVYQLTPDERGNHIHGGLKNYAKVVWQAQADDNGEEPRLHLAYSSWDGEEGYPGNLAVTVVYTLTQNNALQIEYDAVPDQDTLVNMTHHGYFNLSGAASGDILRHELRIAADAFLPVDPLRMPTGEIRPVRGTPFDFRRARAIGARIDADDELLRQAGGYDHHYVLRHAPGVLAQAAELFDPASGRLMQVHTTAPGMQFFSGNTLNGSLIGKGGVAYQKRAGLCLETQHFPDSPNHPHFPSIVVRAGEHYRQLTRFRFLTG